jgi:hypothetical protein
MHSIQNWIIKRLLQTHSVRLDYQPPANNTFLSEQTSHHQSANSTFLSEQISISYQPPAKRTGCWLQCFKKEKFRVIVICSCSLYLIAGENYGTKNIALQLSLCSLSVPQKSLSFLPFNKTTKRKKRDHPRQQRTKQR